MLMNVRRRPSPARAARLVASSLVALAGLTSSALGQGEPEPAPAPTGAVAAPDSPRATRTPPELEPFEGRPVRRITLRAPAAADGTAAPELPASVRQLAMNQLRLREGAPFTAALAAADVARLNRLGRFRQVESRVQPLTDGGIELIYILSAQPIIRDVQATGNERLSDPDIAAMVDLLRDTPVDSTQIDRAARRIEDRYRELGFFNARVTIDERELAENGIVLFQIREGPRTKVAEIRFEGNASYLPEELKTAIKTREAWLLDRGPLDNDVLADDVASLIAYYRDRGHLDVRADRVVTPSSDGREAIVTFVIDEGPVYTLRTLRLEYADEVTDPAFTAEQLLGLTTIKPGDVYSEDKLRQSVEIIRNAFGRLGYVDVQVIRRELRDPDSPQVDLLIAVRQGRMFRTGEVIIQGNTLTRDRVIRRSITLQPDRPLDTTAARDTERRLRNTRLFELQDRAPRVTIQPEDPENPGYRDVLVQVTETNTGEFNFGGAVSSDGGLGARIAVTQRNFDISRPPSSWDEFIAGEGFRGAGQTFSINILPGDRANTFSVSLAEPSLFDSDIGGSASVYWRTRDFDSYNERRVGTQLAVSRRFGERWTASVPLRLELFELGDIDPSRPTDYFDVEGEQTLSSIGLDFGRSTFDDPVRPSRGSRLSVGVDQYFGDFNFTRVDARANTYLNLYEDFMGRRTLLNLSARLGFIPQGNDETPFFERFYMGGQNFRGFAFRTISPRGVRQDNGQPSTDPIGGDFSLFLGAEVTQPVYEDILAIAAFIDTGTVDEGILDITSYRVSAGFGLRLFIPALGRAPLAFDFGFPILKEDTDRERLFTFSLDVPIN